MDTPAGFMPAGSAPTGAAKRLNLLVGDELAGGLKTVFFSNDDKRLFRLHPCEGIQLRRSAFFSGFRHFMELAGGATKPAGKTGTFSEAFSREPSNYWRNLASPTGFEPVSPA